MTAIRNRSPSIVVSQSSPSRGFHQWLTCRRRPELHRKNARAYREMRTGCASILSNFPHWVAGPVGSAVPSAGTRSKCPRCGQCRRDADLGEDRTIMGRHCRPSSSATFGTSIGHQRCESCPVLLKNAYANCELALAPRKGRLSPLSSN